MVTAFELQGKLLLVSASSPEEEEMKQAILPPGWDEERVKRVLDHYESQTEDEALAEDEAAFEAADQTVMKIPSEIVPKVREFIAEHRAT